jgi:predicted translin family RNA/ssDNA-binding protein
MSELIERLLAAETDLTDCAADHIEQLERERDAALAAQSYSYIGKDMQPILARDLEDAKDAAEAKLAKAIEALKAAKEYIDELEWFYGGGALATGNKYYAVLAELEGTK